MTEKDRADLEAAEAKLRQGIALIKEAKKDRARVLNRIRVRKWRKATKCRTI